MKRDKKIDKAIRLTWKSLESHLEYTHDGDDSLLWKRARNFHRECIRDYAKVILILSQLYDKE